MSGREIYGFAFKRGSSPILALSHTMQNNELDSDAVLTKYLWHELQTDQSISQFLHRVDYSRVILLKIKLIKKVIAI